MWLWMDSSGEQEVPRISESEPKSVLSFPGRKEETCNPLSDESDNQISNIPPMPKSSSKNDKKVWFSR